MVKQVREFLEEVLIASKEERDHRFRQWAKWIDAVDPEGVNGYAFEGDFVGDDTVEVEVGEPRVILVGTCSGSHKYQVKHYRIVVLETDGALRWTHIGTDNRTKGWALRIRDQVAALLVELDEQAVPIITAEDVTSAVKVLLLMPVVGITVTDASPDGEEIEVKHEGDCRWMKLPEAAKFIYHVIKEALDD